MSQVAFTVFTKPWPRQPLAELARHVAELGFEGVELPVRPGFQVCPERVAKALPEAAKVFADYGLRIGSVAGPTDAPTIAACARAGVPVIRICCEIPPGEAYLAAEAELKRRGYAGDVCLTAEYSDRGAVDRLVAEDLAYIKSLFAGD